MADVFDSISGFTGGIDKLVNKNKPAPAASAPDLPQVPVERLVQSPKRVKGKGRRDTVLTGEDGLS